MKGPGRRDGAWEPQWLRTPQALAEHAGRISDSTPLSSPSQKLWGAQEKRAKDARLRERSRWDGE